MFKFFRQLFGRRDEESDFETRPLASAATRAGSWDASAPVPLPEVKEGSTASDWALWENSIAETEGRFSGHSRSYSETQPIDPSIHHGAGNKSS